MRLSARKSIGACRASGASARRRPLHSSTSSKRTERVQRISRAGVYRDGGRAGDRRIGRIRGGYGLVAHGDQGAVAREGVDALIGGRECIVGRQDDPRIGIRWR